MAITAQWRRGSATWRGCRESSVRRTRCDSVSRERSIRLLARHAEQERQRDTHLMTRLQNGEQLDSSEVLGCSLDPDTAVYPAGLILDDFLPLALAISANVCIRVPSLFTLAEFEETLGVSYPDFLNLVDRGLVTPILNDYEFYEDVEIVAPIVNQRRPHLTEQRVMLNLLAGSDDAWRRLVLGLEQAPSLSGADFSDQGRLGDRGAVSRNPRRLRDAVRCRIRRPDPRGRCCVRGVSRLGLVRRDPETPTERSPSLEEVRIVLTTSSRASSPTASASGPPGSSTSRTSRFFASTVGLAGQRRVPAHGLRQQAR